MRPNEFCVRFCTQPFFPFITLHITKDDTAFIFIKQYLFYLLRYIIKSVVSVAVVNMLLLCHVMLSDCFYYTRQATHAIPVISGRHSESNGRVETSSCFKEDFHVTMKETGKSGSGGLEVRVRHMAS